MRSSYLLRLGSSMQQLLLLLLLLTLERSSNGFTYHSPMSRRAVANYLVSPPVVLLGSSAAATTEHETMDEQEGEPAMIVENLKGATPKMTKVNSLDQFLAFLAEDDRLCVIKFHADWCKSCQKFGLKYSKLAHEYGDWIDHASGDTRHRGTVRFASVEYGSNLKLCRSLGIKKLPSIQIYYGPTVGRITQFACGPSKFPMLVEKIQRYLPMTEEELLFEKNMEAGGELGDVILQELKQEAEKSAGPSLNDMWSSLERRLQRMINDD